MIDESAQWVKAQQDDVKYPLNYAAFMEKAKEAEAKSKKFTELKDYKNNLAFKTLPHDEEIIKKDTVLQNKRKRWYKSLNNDVYVNEAVNVLKDIKSIK